ncbi:MAG: phosphatase PAP2 family protein [Synechococcaceae cyanobacterium]|nr:phosphatase PAP2 family protein [Synechococcaceae cyanobacterium]
MTNPCRHWMRLSPTLLLWAALGLPAGLRAEPNRSVDHAAGSLRLEAAPLIRITGAPPRPGSQEASSDRAILLWLQQARTPEMEANSWLTLERDPIFFSRALGLDMVKLTPRLNAGLRSFLETVDQVLAGIKKTAGRLRPYQQYAEIRPCLPSEDSASFPSGHSTWYRAASELLADLLPERRQRLLAVGLHAGASRVMCGVHFPSDVEAGQRLGAAAAAQVIASPQWRAFRDNPGIQSELQRLRAVPEASLPLLVR